MIKETKKRQVSLTVSVTVLGVDSNYEPITSAGYKYREQYVYPKFESAGYQVRKLQGPLARRSYVAPEAIKPEVDYISGIGHGFDDRYTGHFGEIIWQIGNYAPSEVKGKIVHLLSCQTAKLLGRDFVKNGCVAFFGYDENFTYMVADQDLFFSCDSEIDIGFAEGLNAEDVYIRVKAAFENAIAKFKAKGQVYQAAMLKVNLDHLRCPSSGGSEWGDASARLS